MAETEKNQAQQPAEAEKSITLEKKESDNRYLIKERFEINYDEPLPELDANGAVAYKVTDKIDSRRKLFALICSNETAPRCSLLPYIKSIETPGLMKLVEYGSVNYKEDQSRRLALIYQMPLGGRVMDFLENDINYQTAADKLKGFILNILSAIETMKSYNITHRNIRLDNLYYRDSSRTEIILGDCLASFPAFYQPAAYETIESLMSLPEGRGNGTDKNDIYALGVTAISLLLRKDLHQDLDTTQILRLKLKKGSYLSLVNDEKIPAAFINIFKNMLQDSELLRWNYVQIYNALEGKNNNYPVAVSMERSQRALTIKGEKIYNAKDVIYNLYNNPSEGIELIKNGKLMEWIRSGLENEKLAGKIEKLLKGDPNLDIDKITLAKICILIDPSLPIHIGQMSVFPAGAPKAIFYAIKTSKNLNDFQDLFASDLVKLWYQEQEHLRSPSNASEFKSFIRKKELGHGLVRIMYDFDDDLPCISPLLGNEFVYSPAQILRALDNSYATINNLSQPYDNNILSFLRCKMGKKLDNIIADFNSPNEAVRDGAMLRLYTDMQNKYGPSQLLNLTKWVVNVIKPVVKTFHNQKYQKFLEQEMLKLSKNGKLYEVYEILDNEEARQKDKEEYNNAVREITYLVNEHKKLTAGGKKLDEDARDLALKFATILGILTMITSFVGNLFYWMVH